MDVRQAVKIAMQNEEFKKHVSITSKLTGTDKAGPCLMFSISSESFYYGYDVIDLQTGKHTPDRAKELIESGRTLVVSNNSKKADLLCVKGHKIEALKSNSHYIGTVDAEGFPFCRISEEYFKSMEKAQDALNKKAFTLRND